MVWCLRVLRLAIPLLLWPPLRTFNTCRPMLLTLMLMKYVACHSTLFTHRVSPCLSCFSSKHLLLICSSSFPIIVLWFVSLSHASQVSEPLCEQSYARNAVMASQERMFMRLSSEELSPVTCVSFPVIILLVQILTVSRWSINRRLLWKRRQRRTSPVSV